MNKILKMCIGIFIWLIILAIGAGVFIGLSMPPEDWNTTTTENHNTVLTPTVISTTVAIPTPISPQTSEINDEWIREYTNLRLRWAQTYFLVNGTIEFKDDRYYIKCKGMHEDDYYILRMEGYADRVEVRLTDVYLRNYLGDADLRDHKILKDMIKNSRETS